MGESTVPVEFSLAEVHEAIAATRPEQECLVFRDRASKTPLEGGAGVQGGSTVMPPVSSSAVLTDVLRSAYRHSRRLKRYTAAIPMRA